MPELTPDVIINGVTGLIFVAAGIAAYVRTRPAKVPSPRGVMKITDEETEIVTQLRRIADALEEANDDETQKFQSEMRERLKRLDEAASYKSHD
jgi:DNA-binding ferritin-like protein|tara:strand:- start:1391 stop:1672 length:282 start_codon:yes stop_codon:yes gene_type:complete